MAPFDPSLWLVHYGPITDGTYRIAQQQIQLGHRPDIQKTFSERQQLERQGQLLRKEFMLSDKSNWPEVKYPLQLGPSRAMYPAAPQHMAGMNRNPQLMQHQAPVGPSPAKRARQAPPSQMPGSVPPQALLATDIADEEDTTHGDMLDALTARDISQLRYQQHHEWMEEVFSAYSTSQILPIDLSFGLMGELASLTKGLFDSDSAPGQPPSKPKTLRKLEPTQYSDFKNRVSEFQKAAEAEIELLKAEHTKKLADLKRTRTYVQAERHLREAEWDTENSFGVDGALENTTPNSSTVESRLKVARLVNDVEKAMSVSIVPQKEITTVDKGGLIEDQPVQVNGHAEPPSTSFQESNGLNGLLEESALDADNTAASLLDEFTQNSLGNTPAAPGPSQPESLTHSNAPTPSGAPTNTTQTSNPPDAANAKVDTAAAGTADIADNMDLDVDLGGEFSASLEEKPGESDWVMVDQPAEKTTTQDQPQQQQTAAQDVTETTKSSDASSAAPTAAPESTTTSGQAVTEVPSGETPGMFDTTDFDAFEGLDTAGDALADAYGTGADDDLGLDLDNSAFGEAFQDADGQS